MKILFVDPKSWTAYDGERMRVEGIGGTESSLVRVARGVAAHHEVAVAQLERTEHTWSEGVRYGTIDDHGFGDAAPDLVVVLRKHKFIPRYRRRFPRAALATWVHNWQRPETALQRVWLARAKAAVITVSDAHCAATDRVVNAAAARALSLCALNGQRVPVRRVYNPIDDALAPDTTVVDPNRLLFLSTPNKGLNQVLRHFVALRRVLPQMELLVAGNAADAMRRELSADAHLLDTPGVRILGRMPQHELMQYLRSALCVFYPQNRHSETFGLIFAEANAVGTPVLAHDFGAAREVLNGAEQLVDANDTAAVIAKVRAWHEGGRPTVSARPEFRTTAVVQEWLKLIETLTTEARLRR